VNVSIGKKIVLDTEYLAIDLAQKTAIPDEAPRKWPGKRYATEPLPDFFRAVWGQFLSAGLTMSRLAMLDTKLYNAICQWRKNKLPWPEDLELPNQRTALQKSMEEFNKGNLDALSPDALLAIARKRKREALASPKQHHFRGGPK
jgi:hypothetical protein